MKKSLLKKYLKRLERFRIKESNLDLELYDVSFQSMQLIEQDSKLAKKLTDLLNSGKSYKAAALLMKKGKLINGEPEKEKIAGFNLQVEKWIAEFSSDLVQENISDIIDKVRAKEFSRAKVLINRKWEEKITSYSPFVSFFKRIPQKYFMYLLIFGQLLFGLIWLSNDIIIARKSMNWPSIQGEVISSKIHVYTQTSSDKNDYPSERRETYYNPVIIYTYKVNGIKYENDDIYIGGDDESTNRENAEICLAERPVGTVVDVYYDPSDPQTATLVFGITEDIYVGLILIVGFIGISFFIFSILNKKDKG